MTAIRVFIATTEGPAEVQRITPEEPSVRSVICLDGKALALPVSADYDAFIRKPTGVIEAGYGHPAYRMDVSLQISGGMSWQLGALVAHALFASDRLAHPDQAAGQAVWLSGEVDRDLNVIPVGHLEEKLRSSAPLLTDLAASGAAVTLCVPRDNANELDPALLADLGIGSGGCRLLPVDRAFDVLKFLGLPLPAFRGGEAASAVAPQSRPNMVALGLGLVAAAVAAMAAGWWGGILDRVGLDLPAFGGGSHASGLSIAAVELRPEGDDTCAAVIFGAAEPRSTEIALLDAELTKTGRASELCGLRYKITNGRDPTRVWVLAARSTGAGEGLDTRTFVQAYPLRESESFSVDVRLPRRLEAELLHRLAVIALPQPETAVPPALTGIAERVEGFDTPEDWEQFLSGLDRAGLEVRRAAHALSP